jgi:hypothetical protein
VSALTVTSLLLSVVEHWNYFSSLWFSVVTALTIGYGDVSPHTVLGREITLAFAHVCILLIAPSIVSRFLLYVVRNLHEWLNSEQNALIGNLRVAATKLGYDVGEEPADTDYGNITNVLQSIQYPLWWRALARSAHATFPCLSDCRASGWLGNLPARPSLIV